MQTVHFNKDTANDVHKMPDAAVGILFDTEKYNAKLTSAQTAIIDNFFDSLEFEKTADAGVAVDAAVKSTTVAFANLMNVIDWNNRWVYKGSTTIPPCEGLVYWNVVATIYPIKKKHLDNFKKTIAKAADYDPKLDVTGNYRNT